MRKKLLIALAIACLAANTALAAEICGNGQDDDSDDRTDEGCFPGLTTGVCESPLSCSETGMISTLTGSSRYQLPADIAPHVPYGPGIGLRRFYTSQYAPTAGSPAWRTPLGDRWQHTYMTWIIKTGSAPSSKLVLHTTRGQDVQATYVGAGGGYDYYVPQPGFHVAFLRQRQAGPNEFELRSLTGETFIYNSSGRLTEIWETPDGGQKALVAYDGAGQVSTVTDASGKRRLLFSYASNRLTTVEFQFFVSSWSTVHTTTYAYSSSLLSTVTIGGALAQVNNYTSNYLTKITDSGGNLIVGFAYTANAGQVARVETPSGTIGMEYNSSRASCSGKTVLHFNRGNASSCSVDSDCGAGFLCGGKTGTGSTGVCFRAARCLTTASLGDDVVTNVAALGPPSESCTGACAAIIQYLWDTSSGKLDLQATKDATNVFTSRTLDANGMPTVIGYGDTDSNPATSGQARLEFRKYGDAAWPGKPTVVRRPSELDPNKSSCTATSPSLVGCAATTYDYDDTTGRLISTVETGYTRDASGAGVPYSYTTTFTYDANGRLTQIDGPLPGSDDVTVFEYFGATGNHNDNQLRYIKRKYNSTSFLITEATGYNFWGKPGWLVDPDGTYTCLSFSASRGYLTERREAMAGQTNCTTVNVADLRTLWARDSHLRLTKLTRPDGSCVVYEYDTSGRLARTKRRDDCNAASAGDRQDFIYDTEGLLAEVQSYDAAGTLTAKQPYSYFDSRRLERVINPVDVSKWTGITYDARGLVSQVDAAGNLGRTVFNRSGTVGADGRVTSVDKYRTSTAFDTWNLLYDWLGNQEMVTDGTSKATDTERDDLGRKTRLKPVDLLYREGYVYDEASRRITVIDAQDHPVSSQRRTHSYTFDNLGRPLNDDRHGMCSGSSHPEVERSYDALPSGLTCPVAGACNRIQGRLAYVRVTLTCVTGHGTDYQLDQETFYGYDDAGRLVSETIRDDAGRGPEQQIFEWTKNGALAKVTTPSGAAVGWSYGTGTSSNSDADRITRMWRTSTGTPIIGDVAWEPYGPLKSYNQMNTYGGVVLRTRITRNLAYRITGLYMETNGGGTVLQSTVTAEDAKGRITKRDYTPNTAGVTDSYFQYDDQDRLICESTVQVASPADCPRLGPTLKNFHVQATPFTAAGDWLALLRPIPGGGSGVSHLYNHPSGYGTTHRLSNLQQQTFGNITYFNDLFGQRSLENSAGLSNDDRTMSYDTIFNLKGVSGKYKPAGAWNSWGTADTYDARNRRVSHTFTNHHLSKSALTMFYYDPLDRLTEVRVTPDVSVPATYTVYQLFWLGDRLVAYWQTDYPSVTVSKRYTVTDETNRPFEMWSWPTSGDASRVWAINPSAWGVDAVTVGPSIYQPVLFAGQYSDRDTTAFLDDGVTVHRPGFAYGRKRSYDPFTGLHLQVDPHVDVGWNSYVFSNSNPVRGSGSYFADMTVFDAECSLPEADGGFYARRASIGPFVGIGGTLGSNDSVCQSCVTNCELLWMTQWTKDCLMDNSWKNAECFTDALNLILICLEGCKGSCKSSDGIGGIWLAGLPGTSGASPTLATLCSSGLGGICGY